MRLTQQAGLLDQPCLGEEGIVPEMGDILGSWSWKLVTEVRMVLCRYLIPKCDRDTGLHSPGIGKPGVTPLR